jgi:hypothetical protein
VRTAGIAALDLLLPTAAGERGELAPVARGVEWTFPLEFVKIVWGDVKQTAQQVISTTDFPPLGSKLVPGRCAIFQAARRQVRDE